MADLLRSVRTRVAREWESPRAPAAAGALASGYRGLLRAREWFYRQQVLRSRTLPCAVVSIGNLTVGGTGKTPAVEHAARTLADLGARPAIVSRGYGRRTTGVRVVADGRAVLLGPHEAGDEPFLLARRLPGVPVVVGASRYEAARLALDRFGVSAVVVDDGFQHRSLVKDVEVVLVRAASPLGNGLVLPAGPLREPVTALGRADLIVATAPDGCESVAEVEALAARHAPGIPVLAARHQPVEVWEAGGAERRPAAHLAGRRLLGFAGIAWPAGFRRTLESMGVALAGFEAFPDHVWYRREDVERLCDRALAAGAEGLVTTEKDGVRLSDLPRAPVPLYVLGVRFALCGGDEVWRHTLARALR